MLENEIREIKDRLLKIEKKDKRSNIYQIITFLISLIAIIATLSTNYNRIEIAEKSGKFDKPEIALKIGSYDLIPLDTTILVITTDDKFKNIDVLKSPVNIYNNGKKNLNGLDVFIGYSNLRHSFCNENLDLIFENDKKDKIVDAAIIQNNNQVCLVGYKSNILKPGSAIHINKFISSPKNYLEERQRYERHFVTIEVGGNDYYKETYFLWIFFKEYENIDDLANYFHALTNHHNFKSDILMNFNSNIGVLTDHPNKKVLEIKNYIVLPW